MIITIVIPGRGNKISGGLSVLYKYANGLSLKGHRVNLIHTPCISTTSVFIQKIKVFLQYIQGKFDPSYWRPQIIFQENVQLSWSRAINDKSIPDADVIIVSYWQTAEWVESLSSTKGKKVYIVQEFELYMSASEIIKNKMRKILSSSKYRKMVISPAVESLLSSFGVKAIEYLPNGVVDNDIPVQMPVPKNENKVVIGFPYREEIFKRSDLAISVLKDVKTRTDYELEIWTFGSVITEQVPDFVNIFRSPSHDELMELYSKTDIFLTTSDYEGWGLPGSEAMLWGAALVTTDTGGVNAYAENGFNALICDKGDGMCLVDSVLELINQRDRRAEIVRNGSISIREFTWGKAIDRLNHKLMQLSV